MPSDPSPIQDVDSYRRTLAEIRALRGGPRDPAEEERLAGLEAAAADFAERLRAQPLEKGRPPDQESPE